MCKEIRSLCLENWKTKEIEAMPPELALGLQEQTTDKKVDKNANGVFWSHNNALYVSHDATWAVALHM